MHGDFEGVLDFLFGALFSDGFDFIEFGLVALEFELLFGEGSLIVLERGFSLLELFLDDFFVFFDHVDVSFQCQWTGVDVL